MRRSEVLVGEPEQVEDLPPGHLPALRLAFPSDHEQGAEQPIDTSGRILRGDHPSPLHQPQHPQLDPVQHRADRAETG
jgi:hypothetical protein